MAALAGKFDVTVIGGGIIGLATARKLALKHPKLKLCVLEKEPELALHQTKRNSGVVHRGIYYKKNSLKSRFCIKGAELAKQYCLDRRLPYVECGKLIIATNSGQIERLHDLYENAKSNQIQDIELVGPDKIQAIQPGCDKALEAIWSPQTAIVDWRSVALSYADEFKECNGTILTNFTALKIDSHDNHYLVHEKNGRASIETGVLINCCGLYSDMISRTTGNPEHPKIVPFKGKYYRLSDELAPKVKTNIYPVPDPNFPFLGVHITPKLDKSVIIGPTALLSLGYENYSGESFNFAQMYHIMWRSGLRKMIRKRGYLKAGTLEIWKNYSKTRLLEEVQNLMPSINLKDIQDSDFCGIRAQTMTKEGDLVDDFWFETGFKPEFNRILHVRNCPSPAATSSLAIAERLVDVLEERLVSD